MLFKAICSDPVTKLKTICTTVVEDDAVSKELYNEIDLPQHCSVFFSYYKGII